MKLTRAQLEKQFDALYDEAMEILTKFNPCEHKSDVIGRHSCVGNGKDIPNNANSGPQCCCTGCPKWTKKGCVAEKPLTCRTWICVAAANKNPEAFHALTKMASKVMKANFWVFRGDKNKSIELALHLQELRKRSQ